MPSVEIHGGNVEYELLGDAGGQAIVLTPGGRTDKNVPGQRPLAESLAAAGLHVLIWDRPNCGSSDVQFWGETESHMRADTLAELVDRLGLGPVVVAGGSGGARDSMLTVIRHPEIATKLVLWNIVGGALSTIGLAGVYVLPNVRAVHEGGMSALIELPEWQALIAANPNNRERLLSWDPVEFEEQMMTWFNAYIPRAGQTIPGVNDSEFVNIKVPTLIIRGGDRDIDHPRRTSVEVNCLIAGSKLVEPPWAEDAWETSVKAMSLGQGHMFDPWPLAAPLILDFVGQ
jgi:pimeloyl-ACP methyl ester carboxylesterase